MSRRASLHGVASTAGVSVSTVSRWVKGQLSLSPATEARVRQAMAEVGYLLPDGPRAPGPGPGGVQPVAPAPPALGAAALPRPRGTTTATAGVVGMIVPEVGHPYFGRAADAVATAAASHDLRVLIASTRNHPGRQREYVDLLAVRDVVGLVYTGSSAEALAPALASGLPLVVFDERVPGVEGVDSVLVDDYSGGFQATAYLTSLGHRRIALVAGPPDLPSADERARGWRDALVRAGIDPAEQFCTSGSYSEDFGVAALPHLLAAPRVPTAVFAASDTIAFGMVAAARHLGLRVPDDLSVIGFDDVPMAALLSPRLTTLRIPLETMAATAVSLLLDRIADPGRPARSVVTPVALVPGASTARLP